MIILFTRWKYLFECMPLNSIDVVAIYLWNVYHNKQDYWDRYLMTVYRPNMIFTYSQFSNYRHIIYQICTTQRTVWFKKFVMNTCFNICGHGIGKSIITAKQLKPRGAETGLWRKKYHGTWCPDDANVNSLTSTNILSTAFSRLNVKYDKNTNVHLRFFTILQHIKIDMYLFLLTKLPSTLIRMIFTTRLPLVLYHWL